MKTLLMLLRASQQMTLLVGTEKPLGQEADEVLDVQRTSLPKIIEALEKDVSELSQKLGKTTDQMKLHLFNQS